jgi:hypothetical protein
MAERSETKSAKRSFASKIKIRDILRRSLVSHSHFQRNKSEQLIGHFIRRG